jgi:hypothetical protein
MVFDKVVVTKMNFQELNEYEMSASERNDAFLSLYPDISEEQKEAVSILCETELPLVHIENVVFFHQLDGFVSDLPSYAKEVAWYLSTREWFFNNLWVIDDTFENAFAEAETLLSKDVSEEFEHSFNSVSDLFSSILLQSTLNRGETSDFVSCGYRSWRHDVGFNWEEEE